MIRRLCAPVFLLLAALTLSGCFFDEPLTGPSKELNTWIVGVWEHRDDKEKLYRATILPVASDRYHVTFEIPAAKKSETKVWEFEAWISRVGKGNYLTFKCLETAGSVPEGGYVFLHYQVLDQNHFATRQLLLDAAQNASSFQLRKEVRMKQKDGTLYEPGGGQVWTKVSEVYWDPNSTGPQPYQPLQYPEPKK